MNDARQPRILIADDQEDILTALRLLLKAEGFAVDQAHSPAAVLSALDKREYDVLLIDLNYTRDTTSGQEGLDLLSRVMEIDPMLPVVLMTAWGTVDLAVEAMRRGAKDFVQKPWDNARLLAAVRTQASLAAALRKGARLEAQNRLLAGDKRPVMIAEAPAMQPVLSMIERVGPSDANVLITGEPGTGKEVVARTLHAISLRCNQPMVTVNMGGLAEGLFESELFGHVKGAFTDAKMDRVGRFELAEGGTIFLDEIANLPFALQAKLLRVLETGEMERVGSSRTRRVDVRILSATNANLHADSAQGRFRQDLLYRLNTVEIHLPPLRERKEDITLLAIAHLAAMARRYRKQIKGFSPATLRSLTDHPWPGNVRELMHVVERAVLMAQGDAIQPADLALRAPASQGRLEEMSIEEVEEFLIRKALARHDGNVSHAAAALGLSRSALYRRLQRYQI
ncbi:MAG: sigma-54-dependent Fis family transcriptional regulator [Candidatus Solibacter sp.]|nr:sigma-54-dependent Fis family transcriptional regulator [Candidatus Solibacter sp.]